MGDSAWRFWRHGDVRSQVGTFGHPDSFYQNLVHGHDPYLVVQPAGAYMPLGHKHREGQEPASSTFRAPGDEIEDGTIDGVVSATWSSDKHEDISTLKTNMDAALTAAGYTVL